MTNTFETKRDAMVRDQLAGRGIGDPAILDAFRAVPRELFVGQAQAAHAYEDRPLAIEAGQTISQPYIVALMLEAAGVGPDDSLLEVGAGSGYAAAVAGHVARTVVAIERHSELAGLAAERIAALGLDNVAIVEGDGTLGVPERAPFDVILAAASGRNVPERLIAQLAPGGRLVMPLGRPGDVQKLVRVTKTPDGTTQQDTLLAVRFVPLVGEDAWDEGSGA